MSSPELDEPRRKRVRFAESPQVRVYEPEDAGQAGLCVLFAHSTTAAERGPMQPFWICLATRDALLRINPIAKHTHQPLTLLVGACRQRSSGRTAAAERGHPGAPHCVCVWQRHRSSRGSQEEVSQLGVMTGRQYRSVAGSPDHSPPGVPPPPL